jgi:ATPase subunit of ABC transporter with duplicated ATPase domains
MSSSSYLIKATNIYKAYGDRVIFNIGSLQICRGDKIGLVGRNGTGKSTLLAALAGEIELDEGEVEARGIVAVIRQE